MYYAIYDFTDFKPNPFVYTFIYRKKISYTLLNEISFYSVPEKNWFIYHIYIHISLYIYLFFFIYIIIYIYSYIFYLYITDDQLPKKVICEIWYIF